MGDFLTVLKSAGPKLTKVFSGDAVIPYDRAKNFSSESLPIRNLSSLSAALLYLGGKPTRCVIRGAFVGEEQAQAIISARGLQVREGLYPRLNALFDEVPHHWRCDDIDGYVPMIMDPVEDPQGAIRELITTEYPPEFHNASYHWQLSSSHGRKPGVLKCHIWWWIKTPYTGPEHKAWVRALGLPIDVAPYRKVQVHYVANPIFTDGAVDPIEKRAGLYRGDVDEVDLVIDPVAIAAADEVTHEGDDIELVDPTEKPGLIGAFCRAYPISRVIEELLPDEFQYAVGSDRRVSWLNSHGGSPEGCFITDDDAYLGNTHNSDPFDNRLANSWDLVRVFKFGAKDACLSADERALCSVNELPSHQAMLAWAATLDGISEDAAEVTAGAAVTARDTFAQQIAEAPDEQALRSVVVPAIQVSDLGPLDREFLAQVLKTRLEGLLGVAVRIGDARGMLVRPRANHEDDRDMPAWAKPWVYCTDKDRFFHLDTHESVSPQGFNMAFDRQAWAYFDPERGITCASQCCKLLWDVETVAGTMYLPAAEPVFEMLGVRWANTYSGRDIPPVPPVLTSNEEAAIATVEAHLTLLFPDDRERAILVSWLAHNARYPGKKIRWAPFIPGDEGTGKTFLTSLLGHVMGPGNVAPLDANVVCKSDFSGWSVGYCVRAIEEIKLHGVNAHDVVNKIKQFVANDVIDTHGKGKDNFKAINCTNYLVFSNFLDGIVIKKGDRRYYVLPTALKSADAERITEEGHFKRLFDAVSRFPGALRKWLLECPMHPEFDADGWAPNTKTKASVIELSRNFIELAAEEIIEEGAAGVTKWVLSSSCLTAEIATRTDEKIRGQTVHKLLQSMGYTFYGVVKWKGKAHRIWVAVSLGEISTDQVRVELDAAKGAADFLQ